MLEPVLQVDNKLVKHVAKLAKINIHEDEIDVLRTSMIKILEMTQQIEHVKEIKDSNVAACTLAIEDVADDVIVQTDLSEHMSQHFKQFSNGHFQVPTFVTEE